MSKVLIITGSYINNNKPNGIIVSDIRMELESMGIECHLISIEKQYFDINKVPVNTKVLTSSNRNNYFKNIFFRLFYNHNEHVVSQATIIDSIKQLDEKNNYNAFIAVTHPTTAADALYKYAKNKDIKTILYEIDPSSNKKYKFHQFIKKYALNRAKVWEKKIYSLFSYVIHMKPHKKYFDTVEYKEYESKTLFLDIPGIVRVHRNTTHNVSDKVNFIYAGAFFPKLREPYNMLEVFGEVSKKIDINFLIFTESKMNKDIQKYINTKKLTFTLNGLISQKELDIEINKADILISIGNKDSDFLPSKIFYYMSKFKPIIHFYSSDKDSCLEYLSRYPYALVINEKDNSVDNCNKIISFIKNIRINTNHDFPIEEIFEANTPMFTAKAIKELITNE